jgi:hypothetical protein
VNDIYREDTVTARGADSQDDPDAGRRLSKSPFSNDDPTRAEEHTKNLTVLVQVDRRVPKVEWPNGYITFLPWFISKDQNVRSSVSFASPLELSVAIIRMQELALVKSMAKLPLVRSGIISADVHKNQSPLAFADGLSTPLASGECVLVRPSIYTPIGWDENDFREILGLHGSAIVNVQGQSMGSVMIFILKRSNSTRDKHTR